MDMFDLFKGHAVCVERDGEVGGGRREPSRESPAYSPLLIKSLVTRSKIGGGFHASRLSLPASLATSTVFDNPMADYATGPKCIPDLSGRIPETIRDPLVFVILEESQRDALQGSPANYCACC